MTRNSKIPERRISDLRGTVTAANHGPVLKVTIPRVRDRPQNPGEAD